MRFNLLLLFSMIFLPMLLAAIKFPSLEDVQSELKANAISSPSEWTKFSETVEKTVLILRRESNIDKELIGQVVTGYSKILTQTKNHHYLKPFVMYYLENKEVVHSVASKVLRQNEQDEFFLRMDMAVTSYLVSGKDS